jgi:ribonucleoside-diphosphate reductase alpha chain
MSNELCGAGLAVLKKRYFKKNKDGSYETWEELCDRVAKHVAGAELCNVSWERTYKDLLYNLDFLPNSPALKHYGNTNGCGAACFVLPIEDSRRSIFGTLSDAVDVQAHGGGTGFAFSRLRPEGFSIKSTGGKASGPISFMKCYNYVIGKTIRQGGVRDGANMGVLRVDHPDIEKFVTCKSVEGELTHFNTSVGITTKFMESVEKNLNFDLPWDGRIIKTVKAKALWDLIISQAWANGEPGLFFLDTVNKRNPLSFLGEIEACNPCGEQPLLSYGVCNLGSINLANHLIGLDNWITKPCTINWKKLQSTVETAVRFLDSAITIENYPLPQVHRAARNTRQIGLGIMGFAEMLIRMHARYGSKKSFEIAEGVMEFISVTAKKTSEFLGKEKGHAPVMKNNWDKFNFPLRRNTLLTTIAPTGSLSLIANCSAGCEPVYAPEFEKIAIERILTVSSKPWQEYYLALGKEASLPDFMVTASQVSPEEHVEMQATFQQHIDSGVSKTVNLPNSVSQEDVNNIYWKAWQRGCKGITVCRDACRDIQAQTEKDPVSKNVLEAPSFTAIEPSIRKRPKITVGPSIKLKSACGTLYIDANFDRSGLCEVFLSTTGGGCEANTKAIGILLSYALRAGVDPQVLAKKLGKIQCKACQRALLKGETDVDIISCPAGAGEAILLSLQQKEDFVNIIKQVHEGEFEIDLPKSSGLGFCPDCQQPLRKESGCLMCPDPYCGWSRC